MRTSSPDGNVEVSVNGESGRKLLLSHHEWTNHEALLASTMTGSQAAKTRRHSSVSFLLIIWLLFPAGVTSDETGGVATKASVPEGRVVQLSPCRAIIDDRMVNLQPLQRTHGSPRFVLELDDQWKLSFNPCISFNLPSDPFSGSGDQCHYVAACKYRESNGNSTSTGEHYTAGLQRTALFQLASSGNRPEAASVTSLSQQFAGLENTLADRTLWSVRNDSFTLGDDVTEGRTSTDDVKAIMPVLVLRGIRSMKRRKVLINLICDFERNEPSDALFMTVDSPSLINTSNYYFELHHRCCCPDGCPVNLNSELHQQRHEPRFGGVQSIDFIDVIRSTDAMLNASTTSDPNDESDRPYSGPRQLWIILVVNGFIILSAVLVASLCCRRGGGLIATGPYTYIPALHASRGTVYSVEQGGAKMNGFKSGVKSTGIRTMQVGGAPTGSASAVGGVDYRDYSTTSTATTRLPQLDNCIISSHSIEIGQRLGGGLFGDTYLCEWKSRNMAAKRITVGVHQTRVDLGWIGELIAVLSKQRHAHLASVVGVCLDMKQPYVISEFVDGESLRDLTRRASITADSTPEASSYNSWPAKIKLSIQIADGMAFLHSAKHPVFHRDLRCANVIVDKSGNAKIVDFGITRIIQRLRNECDRDASCYCQKELSALPASIRWTAPEVLANPRASEDAAQSSSASASSLGVLSPACDIFSFAMLLWELGTCSDPFEDIVDERQVVQLVLEGTRPSLDVLPQGTVPHLKELIKRCWSQDPEARPLFKQVALYLKTILQLASKLSSQPRPERSDSNRSTATSIYLRSVFNVAHDA